MAAASVGNALAVNVRRRQREAGVLRSLGLLRRDLRRAVLVMAVSIVAVGIVLGSVIGFALGASVWRVVAEGALVAGDAAPPVGVVAALAPAALAFGLAMAAVPARRIAQVSASAALRAE